MPPDPIDGSHQEAVPPARSGRNEPVESSTYQAMLAFATAPTGADGGVHLGAAVRRLNAVVAASAAGDSVLDEIACHVDDLIERLESYAELSRYPRGERLGGRTGMFVNHPVIGALNPCAPPLAVEPHGERLVGTAIYGTPFEGPPGYVHGGHMAAAFDAMVVMTAGINGLAGLTRSLTIRYRAPAPLGVPLMYVGEVESAGEPSTIVRVVLRNGHQVCAECTGDVATRPRSRP